MKILDAGTKVLSDYEVLTFIRAQESSHRATDAAAKKAKTPIFPRPKNYLTALKRHKQHLEDAERPFTSNTLYDAEGKHILKLMEALESRVQLTKTELLMIVNHRPPHRELLLPMIEDIESRYQDEEIDFIVEKVGEVLGWPGVQEQDGAQEAGDADGGAEAQKG